MIDSFTIMQVMHAFIITGGTEEKRNAWIANKLQEWSVDSFDEVEIKTEEPSIGISDIRGFNKQLSLAPRGKGRAGIIYDAHRLTQPAQNALLKTLEEPPSQSHIFLVVGNPESLLPTIISRVLVVHLKNEFSFSPEEHSSWLETWSKLTAASPGRQIQLVDSIVTNQETAVRFVSCGIETLHEKLSRDWAPVIRGLLDGQMKLSANVTPKLVLDCVVLSFKK